MGKLSYFDIYGRAEMIRLLLNYAGVDFEDERFTQAEWPEHKASFKTGQVPCWTDDSGKQFGESEAIFKMLAHEHGLAGKTGAEVYL